MRHSTSASQTKKTKKIRYAVVGLGHIAQAAVLPAFKHAKNSELVALVSGDPKKLKQLGRRYKVKALYGYEKYAECLRSGLIDAVYIALPNTLHRQYAEAAARAGIHVLCEKPLAMTEESCESMIATAITHGTQLMVGYRLHFERANLEAIKLAQSGKLGDLRLFNSTFTMQIRDKENIRLRRELGGGPIWDIGIYCVNAARYLFRAEPTEVIASAVRGSDARFKSVDEAVSVTMRFPNERLATFTCSFGADETSQYEVIGTQGRLRVDSAYDYAMPITLEHWQGSRKKSSRRFAKRDQFAAELTYFAECVQTGKLPEPHGLEGLADVRILNAIMHSARSGKAIELGGMRVLKKSRRPSMKQEIRKPAHGEPKLVNVSQPH